VETKFPTAKAVNADSVSDKLINRGRITCVDPHLYESTRCIRNADRRKELREPEIRIKHKLKTVAVFGN